MKHTQGPWRIGNHPSQVVADSTVINTHFPSPPNQKQSEHDEFYGGHLVCESVGNTEDAKLIAAAPELLDACIMALHTLDMAEIIREPGTASNKLYNAIKKATE